MAVLDVDVSFPHAPITSLQKRISKGVEQLYYAKLFLTSPAYADGVIWHRWHELGFHVAIFSPPPGTLAGDRVRVRTRGPSPTPRVSATSENAEALRDLRSLLQAIDAIRPRVNGATGAERAAAFRDSELGRVLTQPLVEALSAHGLDHDVEADYLAMLQRAFDALTDDRIISIGVAFT